VITPRTTRLLRTRSLPGYLEAIRAASSDADPCLVIVPTQAAARVLERTLQHDAAEGVRAALPDVRTRGGMYERLAAALDAWRAWLSPFERDVILEHGAHEAVTEGLGPPFNLRPALIGEMLELYDALRRHQQDVEHFERLLVGELEPYASIDRGAERVLRQTRFLAAAFRSYQRDVGARGGLDEHGLRERLLSGEGTSPWRHVVVTVGDHTMDHGGLWPADFDLLARLEGIKELDVVVTEARLAAGFHERVHALLPGIEEVRWAALEPPPPVLSAPSAEVRYFTSRDREEELAAVVRGISSRVEDGETASLGRTAVVYARPLPYLYVAPEIFASAAVPFQSGHARPLAAEPMAAAVDLVLAFVASAAGREATLSLLRSPHVRFSDQAADDWERAVGALETALSRANDAGGIGGLEALAGAVAGGEASGAVAAALGAASALRPLFGAAPSTTQLSALKHFLDDHEPVARDEREHEARRAVRAVLQHLIDAHDRSGAATWTIEDLAPAVRRWIEAHTFEVRTAGEGIHLIDAVSARYGMFEEVHLVGLVDGEWPERRRRNIFYSSLLLRRLGWGEAADPLATHRAAFDDLLRLASRRTSVSTVQLEDDTLVEPSPLLEELAGSGLEVEVATPRVRPASPDDGREARGTGLKVDPAEAWAQIRTDRSDAPPPASPGRALPAARPEYSVGSIELYAQCPFKYFARHVLGLEEEIEEEDGLSPRERGIFVHEVFCAFFERWQASGRGRIQADLLDEALALLEQTAGDLLARLPPADASIERARLLGSPVAPGIADLVLRMEAERSTAVIERRLEERFSGTFALRSDTGPRPVAIRGVVDRIDLLADGSLRVLDYKSSVPPVPLQLAIYAATAVQRLLGDHGRRWTVGEAAYVVYGPRRGVKTLARSARELERAIEEAEEAFMRAVDGIESGEFPPRPAHVGLCASCAYSTVCRREYIAQPDDADTAPAL
jgi:RecB family exonuclease